MMSLVITLLWAALFFWFTRRADKLFRALRQLIRETIKENLVLQIENSELRRQLHGQGEEWKRE